MKLMTIPERFPPKLSPQSLKEKTAAEHRLVRRRRQILDDETLDRFELDTPERKSAWVKDFIDRFAGVIRNIGGKR
jgi:hypothetical protein